MNDTVRITLDREDADRLALWGTPSSEAEAMAYGEADERLVAAIRAALDTPAPEQSHLESQEKGLRGRELAALYDGLRQAIDGLDDGDLKEYAEDALSRAERYRNEGAN